MANRLETFHLPQNFGHLWFLEVHQTKRSHVHAVVLEILQVERLYVLRITLPRYPTRRELSKFNFIRDSRLCSCFQFIIFPNKSGGGGKKMKRTNRYPIRERRILPCRNSRLAGVPLAPSLPRQINSRKILC